MIHRERPKILINPYLSDQSELNTAIHNSLDTKDKSEKDVASFTNAISRFLYNECHWRKHSSKNQLKSQKEMNDSTKIEIAKAALKEIGNLTVEGCEDNNSEIARKYELNKLG